MLQPSHIYVMRAFFFFLLGRFKYPRLCYGHPSAKMWMFPPGIYHFSCSAMKLLQLQALGLSLHHCSHSGKHSAALYSRLWRDGNSEAAPSAATLTYYPFLLPGKQNSHEAKPPRLFGGMSVSQSFKIQLWNPKLEHCLIYSSTYRL